MLEFMKLFTQICAALILGFQLTSPALAVLDDWMTWASTYTHDSQGVRVDQYAMPVQPLGPDRDSYQRSGYRHFRSTLQAGQSADNYHVVEQFGAPVIPYEQWRFPFRPYGVPYDAWGPQTPLSMTSINAGGFFPGAYGFPPGRPGLPPVGTGTGAGTGTGTGSGAGMGTGTGPAPMWPGYGYPGYGYPGYSNPGYNNQGYFPGQGVAPGAPTPFGFPLQPQYQNQPWFDGTYPDAPPLDPRSDRQFFWVPPR